MRRPHCDFVNPPQAKFCGQCAAPLSGSLPASIPSPEAPYSRVPLNYTPAHLVEMILTSRSGLEGEHQHVTVLFADLEGSIEVLADRDAEEAQ